MQNMGCSSSNSSTAPAADGIKKVEPRQTSAKPSSAAKTTEPVNYPPSEAYVISFNENNENDDQASSSDNQTIITTSTWNAETAAKTETFQPPVRLQKALEGQTNSNAADSSNVSTIETITEKLEKAEQRRQAIIQEKIEKAQKLIKNLDETFHENKLNKSEEQEVS